MGHPLLLCLADFGLMLNPTLAAKNRDAARMGHPVNSFWTGVVGWNGDGQCTGSPLCSARNGVTIPEMENEPLTRETMVPV
jgi:hypothetical protein